MEIPYTVTARPDTGLWNAKIGIWLFLASEVMLFGGFFSAYIFLRLDAQPGYWPHGLLNVPVGTMNTADPDRVLGHGGAGLGRAEDAAVHALQDLHGDHDPLRHRSSLFVKLYTEWPQKFHHFGAYIKPSALEKYEPISATIISSPRACRRASRSPATCIITRRCTTPNIKEYEVGLDPIYTDPTNPEIDRPHFLYVPPTDKIAHDRQGGCGAGDDVYARRTTPISRPISRSPGCTACTCSGA